MGVGIFRMIHVVIVVDGPDAVALPKLVPSMNRLTVAPATVPATVNLSALPALALLKFVILSEVLYPLSVEACRSGAAGPRSRR